MNTKQVCIILALLSACGDDASPGVDAGPMSDARVDGGTPPSDVGIGPLTGFDPAVHGFGFENYTNMSMPVNLTPAEMSVMFGDQVCARGMAESCVLTAPAQSWMEETNRQMNVGHCEGMAVMALTLFHGLQSHTDFGGMSTSELQLAGNMELSRSIAFFWAAQKPLARQRLVGTPNEQVERLRQSFAVGSMENYTIAFFKRDATGGHAVTPFAIEDEGGNALIRIYDNNFPGMTRTITVNTAANTWTYEASQNPGAASSLYEGDATVPNLQLVPLSARLAQQPCSFCGNAMTGMSAMRRVTSSGEGDVLITDPTGARLGQVDGALVNEIAGADVFALLSADLFDDDQDPFYDLPGGTDLDVTLFGADFEGQSESSLSITGAGYFMGVSEVVLDPGQEDLVSFAGDRPNIYYETEAEETAVVEIAVETPDADWSFALRSRGESGGQSIELEVVLEDGEIVFGFGADDAETEFDLEIERIDDDGSIVFYDANIVVPNEAVLYLTYADFDVDGEQLVLGIDTDDDGIIDEELMLTDER